MAFQSNDLLRSRLFRFTPARYMFVASGVPQRLFREA